MAFVRTLTAAAVAASALAATAAAAPSPSGLPDWSGVWESWAQAHGKLRTPGEEHTRPPFKDAAVAAKFFARQAFVNGGGSEIYPACPPPRIPTFTGQTGGGPTTMTEFLFTPGRVTILTSNGMVRRIYTGGQKLPDAAYVTATGTSRGHWEGQTLVVETTGLNPDTMLLGMGKAGEGFKVDERIYLKSKGVLEVDATITAPGLFSAPYRMYPQLLQRRPYRHELMQEVVAECAAVDRAVDRATNTQTFDFTPPPDLPPPPSN